MKPWEFQKLTRQLCTNGHIDPEKVKVLPDNLKSKVVTFLVNSNRPVLLEFVTQKDRQRLEKKGYKIEQKKGISTYLFTYWQTQQNQ